MWRVSAALLTCLTLVSPGLADEPNADSTAFDENVRAVFSASCVKCHGKGGEAEGEVNLLAVRSPRDLATQPELLRDLIEAVDSSYMPPEDEPNFPVGKRKQLVAELKTLFQITVHSQPAPRTPIRRMNRFQYNNAVQDLFELKVEVFSLPERMMREHGNYFQPQTGKMPARLGVGSRPLGKSQLIEKRLAGVAPFPQDLRAEHGFDNRGDHLSLSPLLLESFFKVSRSVVESPDFHDKTCGIWPWFFAPLSKKESESELAVETRLRRFLTRAFRRPVEEDTLKRYSSFVLAKLKSGEPMPKAMKAAAAAAIASPRFFYLYDERSDDMPFSDDFDLASRMSFFLWGSIPDESLLEVAESGSLREPKVLAAQVDRMLKDRRLKRFCDSFPAQWLQLERIITSEPDRQKFPQFYFSKYRASMHMMLEPLLLFETVLIENRPILEFIDSDFSYRSNLLEAWYRDGTRSKPTPVVISFRRVPVTDRRQGGLITNAAVMTMTSGANRTRPITRGAWMAGVILNDPPEPPPADVPLLNEKPTEDEAKRTLRERFAEHRKRLDCAGCHRRIDPLGFALENYDVAGLWRDKYENGRKVDSSGTLFGRHDFRDIVEFKDALLAEKDRFARGLAEHLLSFSLGREIGVADSLALDEIVQQTAKDKFRIQTLIRQVVLSEPFRFAGHKPEKAEKASQ